MTALLKIMKMFYCRVDVGDDIPVYDFIVKAEDIEKAEELAEIEASCYEVLDISIEEVKDYEWLLSRLVIN